MFRSPNLPSGPVGYSTATLANQNGENTIDTATISASYLRVGTNLCAVEIHQSDAGSSDVSFDLELVGYGAPVVAGPQPIYWGSFDGQLVLGWGSAGLKLAVADDVGGPWVTLGSPSPVVITPGPGQQFFKLVKP